MPAPKWSPQPKQELFLRNPAFEALFGGSKGGGKTDALLAEATRQLTNPNYRAIIFRRTFPQIQEVIDRAHKWFKGLARWQGDLHRYTWPNGSFIAFGHCNNEDDKYNYQGHEYTLMLFDQLEQFTQTMYEFLIAQIRTSDPKLTTYVRSSANPGGIGHSWVKQRFIDSCSPDGAIRYFMRDPVTDRDVEVPAGTKGARSRAFVASRIWDNQVLMNADPNYINTLNSLPDKLRRALRDGDWDAYEGQYFSEWRRDVHIIPRFDFTIPHTKFIALDYGYTKQSSVGWYAVTKEKIVRYRELYVEGKTYEELGKLILEKSLDQDGSFERIEYMVCDPAIWGDKKHFAEPKEGFTRGESGFDVINAVINDDKVRKELGVAPGAPRFPVIRGDNRRVVGWGKLRVMLKPYEDQFGQLTARFQVTESCKNYIRTLPGLIFDKTNPEDVDTTGEDHAADESRYAVMSRPLEPKEPQKVLTPADDFWARVKLDQVRFEAKKERFEGQERTVSEDEGARELEEAEHV